MKGTITSETMNMQLKTNSSDETEQLGAYIGSKLIGGEIIELVSDLGGGKTTLVRGISTGAKSKDAVSSPSFTISNVYETETFSIYHYDFYRLDDPGIMAYQLSENLNDIKKVVIIEWGAIIKNILLKPHIILTINQTGEDTRSIIIQYPEESAYIFNDIELNNKALN